MVVELPPRMATLTEVAVTPWALAPLFLIPPFPVELLAAVPAPPPDGLLPPAEPPPGGRELTVEAPEPEGPVDGPPAGELPAPAAPPAPPVPIGDGTLPVLPPALPTADPGVDPDPGAAVPAVTLVGERWPGMTRAAVRIPARNAAMAVAGPRERRRARADQASTLSAAPLSPTTLPWAPGPSVTSRILFGSD